MNKTKIKGTSKNKSMANMLNASLSALAAHLFAYSNLLRQTSTQQPQRR